MTKFSRNLNISHIIFPENAAKIRKSEENRGIRFQLDLSIELYLIRKLNKKLKNPS